MKICIESMEDGAFRVYETDISEQPGQAEQDAQSAATIDEALATAKQMLSGDQGQGLGPDNPFEQPKPDASMQQGFTKARGIPAGM